MAQSLKATGSLIFPMAQGEKYSTTGKCMKVTGWMEEWKVKVFSSEKMELHIQDNGLTTNKTGTDTRNGPMEPNMRVIL